MTDDALNPADADPAKRIVSSSGSLFIPAEDRTVWIVESGAVAIFYTATENQQPCGQRRFLFNCRSGEIIIGGMVGDRDSGGCLIAVAFQDSILRSVVLRPPAAGENSPLSPSPPSPSLAINDATLSRAAGFDCAVAVNALESWIGKLTQQILEDAPSVFVPRTAVGDVQSFDSGQAFGFVGHNVSWVGIENGTIAFCGQDELLLTKESGTVAMGHEGWLKALQPAEVSVRQTSELANANELLDGISALAALCLKQVRTRIIRENQTESQRLQRQQQLERMDTSEALRSVGSVLQSATASVIGDTEIERVLSVIGGTLGVKFCGPADSDESHRSGLTVDAICRASRVPTRNVQLRQRWWKEDHGCLLAYRIDNHRPVALIPQHNGTYRLHSADGSPAENVDQDVAATLSDDAVMFYRPFPDQMADLGSLYRFTLSPLRRDIIAVILIAVAGALLGMLVPQATLMLIDDAIPDGNRSLVIQLALGLLAVTCGQAVFLFSQGIVTLRLQTLSAGPAQSAMWDRLLRLPMRFHRRYSSGDMMNRCLIVSEISEKVSGTILRTMLSGGMSLLTLGLLFFYDARLALIAVLIVAVLAVVVTVLSRAIQVRALALELSSSQIFGYVMQLLYGITKIRVSGGEQQAYNQWARRYAAQLRLTNIVQQLEDWSDTFTHSLPLCSSLILFGFATSFVTQSDDASSSSMSLGTFLAFMTAFGSLLEGGIELSDSVVEVMDSIGKSKLALPILTAPVEVTESRSDPGRLEGAISADDIVFRYRDEGPPVLNHVTFRAAPGEFVAIVGPSGCGKSTLLRLILGFETPQSGTISFDGSDLAALDIVAVRRQIGVVLQNSRISASTILEFITAGIRMTLAEAWELAEAAGLAEDIRAMPMGMHTVISEGGGGFSGGQRQRLMIARALASKARILLFDEATSALDNQTQQIVSDSIRRRHVTRITVAHRLSTIREADRIYVLERGSVVQVGTFEELSREAGLFTKMMERQIA